VPLTLQ